MIDKPKAWPYSMDYRDPKGCNLSLHPEGESLYVLRVAYDATVLGQIQGFSMTMTRQELDNLLNLSLIHI